jgi:hypothetical protein
LETLFCTLGSGTSGQWEIPFTVETVAANDGASGSTGSRVVVIDNPLPGKAMTAKEKNAALLTQVGSWLCWRRTAHRERVMRGHIPFSYT